MKTKLPAGIVLVLISVLLVSCGGGTPPPTKNLDALTALQVGQNVKIGETQVFQTGDKVIAVYFEGAITPAEFERYTFHWSQKTNGQWGSWQKVTLSNREVLLLPDAKNLGESPDYSPKAGEITVMGLPGSSTPECGVTEFICLGDLVIKLGGGE